MNKGKKLLMCGSHQGGALAVEALIKSGYEFSHFVCLSQEQAEKYAVSGFYDYAPMAREHGIAVYHPESYALNTEQDKQFFASAEFDLLIQGGWQRLFPEHALLALSIGALGLHGSSDFLPKGRGRSPMNWCLIEGRKKFLMHLFMIKPGVDDGDVIGIKEFDITDFDDIHTMYYKYAMVYRDLLLKYLPDILDKNANILPQRGEPTYYPKRTEEDGKIDWESMDVWQIYNLIRASTKPYPGAFGNIDGKMVRVWRARPFDTRIVYPHQKYGACVERFDNKLIVNCRGGLLLVDEWEEKK